MASLSWFLHVSLLQYNCVTQIVCKSIYFSRLKERSLCGGSCGPEKDQLFDIRSWVGFLLGDGLGALRDVAREARLRGRPSQDLAVLGFSSCWKDPQAAEEGELHEEGRSRCASLHGRRDGVPGCRDP